MLYNLYQFIHNSLGLCFWDLPALLVGIIMIVVFAVHKHNQKKRQNNFEDELEEKMKAIKEGTAGEELRRHNNKGCRRRIHPAAGSTK